MVFLKTRGSDWGLWGVKRQGRVGIYIMNMIICMILGRMRGKNLKKNHFFVKNAGWGEGVDGTRQAIS